MYSPSLDKLTKSLSSGTFRLDGFVRVSQDMSNVRGEEVVHLVRQGRLEHELRVGGGVPDGEVEEGGSTGPVDDVAEGESGEEFLRSKTY